MTTIRRTLQRSALNVVRGIGITAANLVAPALLARGFTPADFKIAAVIYQFAMQVPAFEAGLTNGVSYFAIAEPHERDKLWSTASSVSRWLQLAVLVVLNGAVVTVLHKVTNNLAESLLVFNVLVLCTLALVPLNIGIGFAQSRSDYAGMLALSWAPRLGLLVGLALIITFPGALWKLVVPGVLLTAAANYALKYYSRDCVRHSQASRTQSGRLLRYMAGSFAWNVASFAISWAVVDSIARAQPGLAGVFSVTFGSAMLIVNTFVALLGPAIPALTQAIHDDAEDAQVKIHRIMMCSAITLSVLFFGIVATCGMGLVRRWLGAVNLPDDYAIVLYSVAIYAVLRAGSVPYSFVIIASGKQARYWIGPVVECASAIILCRLLGGIWGVRGVLGGLTIAAGVGVFCNATQLLIDKRDKIARKLTREVSLGLGIYATIWLGVQLHVL